MKPYTAPSSSAEYWANKEKRDVTITAPTIAYSAAQKNATAPQAIIKQYGADILRLWVAAEDYRDDLRISEETLRRLADAYRRVRNTARNLLGNLYDFDPQAQRVTVTEMVELDRWALTRLDSFVCRCREAYDRYEFHTVYHALNNFCGVDLSSLYFDIVKDRLYCSARDSRERRSAQTVMYVTLRALAGVVAPIEEQRNVSEFRIELKPMSQLPVIAEFLAVV